MMKGQKVRWPKKADYEGQRTLKFTKGTRVRVTKVWKEGIQGLEKFCEDHRDHPDAGWQDAVRTARREIEAIKSAVGKTRTVVAYTIGANPHGIRMNGMLIFLPAHVLEKV